MFHVIQLLWQNRKRIIVVTFGVSALTAVISLLLPFQYTSMAVILPDTDKKQLGGNLSELASLAGINFGGAEGTMTKLYPKILVSDNILLKVITARYYSTERKDSVTLIDYWKISGDSYEEKLEIALKKLTNRLVVTMDAKTFVVSITYEDGEPQLTADVVNRAIKELDFFLRRKRNTSGSEQRRFVEGRLREVTQDLSDAEDRLKEFRERNRLITSSPNLVLEQERLARQVSINSTLFVEMKKQYEFAKIEEVKNIPLVNVLDEARPAAKRSFPRRSIMVLGAFMLSFLAISGYVMFETQVRSIAGKLWSIVQDRKPI